MVLPRNEFAKPYAFMTLIGKLLALANIDIRSYFNTITHRPHQATGGSTSPEPENADASRKCRPRNTVPPLKGEVIQSFADQAVSAYVDRNIHPSRRSRDSIRSMLTVTFTYKPHPPRCSPSFYAKRLTNNLPFPRSRKVNNTLHLFVTLKLRRSVGRRGFSTSLAPNILHCVSRPLIRRNR